MLSRKINWNLTPINHSRYANIDSVRGLAALLVVWMHVSEVFRSLLPDGKPGDWMYQLADAVDFGRMGVVAFFAVSGFVIPASFSHQGWLGLKIFWVRRFFRLYPAFWLSIPLAIWSTWTIWDKSVTPLQILANITIAPGLFNQEPLEGLYWTLQIEMLFYVACSVLFFLGVFRKTQVVATIVFLLFAVFLIGTLQPIMGLPTYVNNAWKMLALYLATMFWGALYRAWHDRKPWTTSSSFVLWGLPIAITLLMTAALVFKLTHGSEVGNIFDIKFTASHALGMWLFIAVALWKNLRFRPLVFLGEISYALYLFHPIVFFPIHWWAGKTQLSWVRTLPLEFWVAAMTLVSVLVAYLVHRWVELPAISKGKDITRSMITPAR